MNLAKSNRIRFGIRGFGGEIGDTMVRVLMRMHRNRFEAFKGVTGESIQAFIRRKPEMSIKNNIMMDRSFAKLEGSGNISRNTQSPYSYNPMIRSVEFDGTYANRIHVTGRDGRVLTVDYKAVPMTHRDLPELRNVDLLVDATGVNLKKIDMGEDQDPNLYRNYSNLTVFFSAPVKTVAGIPHMLNGLGARFHKPAQLNATGSCSTHAGVDLIRYIREGLMTHLGLEDGEIFIEGGQFNSTHALTPSDFSSIGYYNGAFVPQTTGFGGAASVVYPVPNIANIAAATGRYNSIFATDSVQTNGVSVFSLAMTISVAAKKMNDVMATGRGDIDVELINDVLWQAALDTEGRKHIGIININEFDMKKNKKTGMFTSVSMIGMPQTVLLPVRDNISVVRQKGVRIVDDTEYVDYILTINNAAYDNRLGFTVDFMEELNQVANARLGQELIPEFDSFRNLRDAMAFIHSREGIALFGSALEQTRGEVVMDARTPDEKREEESNRRII